ncbi:hypothetical protein Bhyg_15426 [Pseudolycoriella hygida]|uniref:Uncharacterized protein n=1 Tax=Pseudolycoriella hygida TaxID=35572 RepID=A0A9Q0MRV5_9DIPT|nr:hypothetical protein Bhyg_15426 [Pseudolycoriella hygida]
MIKTFAYKMFIAPLQSN